MPLLNEADALYLGTRAVDSVHLGVERVWERAFDPTDIPGLVTWLDAANYTPGSWPNKSTGPTPTIVGTPVMTAGAPQNGMPTVRFKTSEGRLRSTWPHPPNDFTLVYLTRWVGPGIGRAFSVQYPPSNFLVGMHTSQPDTFYSNGTWLTPGTGWNWWAPGPGPWRMYGSDSSQSVGARFLIDGVQVGSPVFNVGAQEGFYNGWGLSGYEANGTGETMDIEVAELVLYNRKLSDVERKQVEDYLNDKWSLLDVDTRAYLTATGLSESYAPALDGLVRGLKDAGLWTKMHAIYPFIGGTEALHKWNLKDPRNLDAAYRLTYSRPEVSSHSTALGYRPNSQGAVSGGGYADTHLVPSSVLSLNSTHLAYYSLADVSAVSRCEIGCYNWAGSGSRFHIIARYTPDGFYYGQSEDGASYGTVPASSGLFVATRTAVNLQAGYRNGTLVASNTNGPASGLPTVPVWVGGINVFQDRSDLPCGFASVGVGLSATDVSSLNLILTDYQTALGRRPAFTGFW